MMSSFAGSIIGIGEIILLPLDVLKIKRQTNPEAFRGRGVFRIVADEGFGGRGVHDFLLLPHNDV